MKRKVLVIEDEDKVALVLAIWLEEAGYGVLTAANGVDGVRLAMQEKPDLVITDIAMPQGGGFAVAYRLCEWNPRLPIIFVTGSKLPGAVEHAKSLGAVGFLEKPCKADELVKTVAKALACQAP